jgi:asparagine synthase (glutamine-hydrolysing)
MDVAMRINPQDKMINKEHPMENGWFVKHLKICYQSVAWNKRAVSDGVGYSWIDTLKEVVAKEVSDEQLANAKYKFRYKHLHKERILLSFYFLLSISQ